MTRIRSRNRRVPLTPCADLSAADWIVGSGIPWEQLVGFGPPGFPAYARLRFFPDPAFEGQSQNDVDRDRDAPFDIARLRASMETLTRHTDTPDACYFCVWEGWPLRRREGTAERSLHPSAVLDGPQVVVPNRAYFLLKGDASDLASWDATRAWLGHRGLLDVPPAFMWPADHAWCIACDVDQHYAGIGATTAAIDELLADPRLDPVPADPREAQPAYR
jgi:hypothetical protein